MLDLKQRVRTKPAPETQPQVEISSAKPGRSSPPASLLSLKVPSLPRSAKIAPLAPQRSALTFAALQSSSSTPTKKRRTPQTNRATGTGSDGASRLRVRALGSASWLMGSAPGWASFEMIGSESVCNLLIGHASVATTDSYASQNAAQPPAFPPLGNRLTPRWGSDQLRPLDRAQSGSRTRTR